MAKFKNKYRSESHRYRYWDYSAPAAYFITAVVIERDSIFGYIENNNIILSEEGLITKKYFEQLPTWNSNIILDEFVIMPNHFHCIIIIKDEQFQYLADTISERDEWSITPRIDFIQELYFRGKQLSKKQFSEYKNNTEPTTEQMANFRIRRRKMTIPKLIGKLKMQISKEINQLNHTPGKKNLQDDFYDSIIRNHKDYVKIKDYIKNNPANWSNDRFSI
jgi:REP element-mobilizing transposase RayT